jgi:hypothetical protein
MPDLLHGAMAYRAARASGLQDDFDQARVLSIDDSEVNL